MSIRIKGLIENLTVWGIAGGVMLFLFSSLGTAQEFVYPLTEEKIVKSSIVLIQDSSVLANTTHFSEQGSQPKIINVVVTAYSSCPWETNEDPFTTASGQHVRDGIVAANFLPFGAQIRIPEVYGNRVFEVQDRMHPRKSYHVDIWFSSKEGAINFGAHYTYIEILEDVSKIVMR
jgi:3D (Asp-Asp-Asp) domain-containing protein